MNIELFKFTNSVLHLLKTLFKINNVNFKKFKI